MAKPAARGCDGLPKEGYGGALLGASACDWAIVDWQEADSASSDHAPPDSRTDADSLAVAVQVTRRDLSDQEHLDMLSRNTPPTSILPAAAHHGRGPVGHLHGPAKGVDPHPQRLGLVARSGTEAATGIDPQASCCREGRESG